MSQSNCLQNQKNNQKWYICTICFIWLRSYFLTLWRRLGLVEVDITNFIILFLLVVLSKKVWKGRIVATDLFLYNIIAFCYFFSVILYPATSDFIYENAFLVIFCTVPYIFIGVIFQMTSYEKWITYASRIAIVMNVVLIFAISSISDDSSEEFMHRAYALLPSVLFLFWQYINSHRLIDLVFVFIGLFLELSMGSRGPIVCFIFFVACYLLFFKKYQNPMLSRSIIIGIISLLCFCTQYIAEFMITLLSRLSMSTRIFDKMLNDAFINYESSSGRDYIQGYLLNKLNEDTSGLGFGLFSDRMTIDAYSHNFFIELWYSFGYYIGTFIIIILFLLFAYFFLITKNREKKVFALLLFSVSVVKLQFSGSFINDQYLFFLIGYCIYGIREYNLSRTNKNNKII